MPFAATVILALAAASVQGAVPPEGGAASETVIGARNSLLADGATALRAGRASDGVRLTLEGLKLPASVGDTAAAHSNLCAGYVLLHQYDQALVQCNIAIALDRSNWRPYNNRAAAYAACGRYDEALADVMAGLKIAPGSAVLLLSLKIIRDRLASEHGTGRSAATA
ncbi:MAG TPA: tetratricopeptide repeat protein [Steroidobacteraceae bacterium]|nr:tetratricopeptide repeat protein [Steroidobacteraceae bacterium]